MLDGGTFLDPIAAKLNEIALRFSAVPLPPAADAADGRLGDTARPAVFRLPVVTGVRGGQVSVPVMLDARGDECAWMFSLHWVAGQLANPRVSMGADVSGFSLTVNDYHVGNGQLVILMDTDPRTPIAAGTRHVVTVTFDIPATASPGVTGLNFAGRPRPLATSDGYGLEVVTAYQNGYVVVLASATDSASNYPTPPLHIEPIGYEGSYSGSSPIRPPVSSGSGTSAQAPPAPPLYIDPSGTISHVPPPGLAAGARETPGGLGIPATLFGFPTWAVAAAAIGGIFLFSSD